MPKIKWKPFIDKSGQNKFRKVCKNQLKNTLKINPTGQKQRLKTKFRVLFL